MSPDTDQIDPAVLCEKVLHWRALPTQGIQWWADGGASYKTPDFENVFADAWLLVEALDPRQQFTLDRWPSEKPGGPPRWMAGMMGLVVTGGRAYPPKYEYHADTPAQAITRVRWLMFQEEGK